MQPISRLSDAGTATVGTETAGPYAGPDTDNVTGLTFIDIDKDTTLNDAIAQLAAGTAPAQQHGYLISVGDVQNVVAVLYSTQMPPNSNLRVVPGVKFKKGERVFIRGVQFSGAQEATQLLLIWAKPANAANYPGR
jgi:hypothetical protein